MLYNIHLITIFIVIPFIFGDWIDFSIDYFKAKTVSFVCLLTCQETSRILNTFSKYASKRNIAISNYNTDNMIAKNIKGLDACVTQTAASIGVLVNAKCPEFETIMYYASERVLFDSKHKWLIIDDNDIQYERNHLKNETYRFDDDYSNGVEFDNDTNVNVAVAVLYNLTLNIDADIILSVKTDISSYALYDVYNFGKERNGRFVVENIGNWSTNKGLNVLNGYTYYRRWDFQQMALKLAVVMSPLPSVFDPQMILGDFPDHRVATITYSSSKILHEISGIHNFKFNYTLFDKWVGDYVKEHKAVSNALYFGEQDITPVIRVLPENFARFGITAPSVSNIETRFFYRIPSQGVGKFENQFLRPLSPGAWWCVVAVCALCCIALLLSIVSENKPMDLYYWCFSIFSVLALICQQFFEEVEDMRRVSAARKVTILVTGLSCILLYNYYTSSVVSWLLNGPPPSINSLWELIDSPLQPMFEDTGYTNSWLQLTDYHFDRKKADSEDALKKKVYNLIKKGKSVIGSMEEGIELVRKGGYAYHAETSAANARISQTFDQRELCDLDSLNSMESVQLYAGVPKNSPYKEFFNWSLARLLERGILRCIHERTSNPEAKCEGSSPRALALGGAAPAFIVLAAGFILATIIMLIERIWWKYSIKTRRSLK